MNIFTFLRLTQKFLWRNLRKGELTLLMLSLIVATATITSVTVFTSRIANSINQEAASYLGADAKITGSMPIPQAWLSDATALQITTANVTFFRAMAFAETALTLVQVKAVSPGYPLKGYLEISDSMTNANSSSNTHKYTHGPEKGTVWLASRLFNTLNIQLNDVIKIGEKELTVAGIIRKEPDSAQTTFGFSPRVIMHIDDVAATQAVQLGSRINYEWLLAGDKKNLIALEEKIETKLGDHFKWRGSKEANRQVNKTMDRADRFLLLGSSLSLLLAGVAIALAIRRFIQRQTSTVAILKTLGVAPKVITAMYFLLVSSLGLFAVCVGCFIGWVLHLIILNLLGDFISANLASADMSAYTIAALAVFVTLMAFCFIPLIELKNTQPSVILRDVTSRNMSVMYSSTMGFVAIFIVLVFFSGNIVITIGLALGVLLLTTLVFLISRLLIFVLSRSLRFNMPWWRIGLVNIKRHQPMTSLQILIFSTVFMLVAVLVEVRTGLMSRWQDQIPENAPNHFAFNIFTDDLPRIKQYLRNNNIQASAYYPMSRGRIYAINGELMSERAKDKNSRMNYERELNLTWSTTLGVDNNITEGSWWGTHLDESNTMLKKNSPLRISVEEEYGKGLNLQLNDEIEFSIAGQKITATLTSFRTVEWDSMNPNFFVIFNQPFTINDASNWVTSFHIASDKAPTFVTGFLREFPSVSVLELEQTLKQIQEIVRKVSSAVEFILWLVFISGLLILLISVQATLDSRKHESALYRVLGAQRQLVRNTLIIEFAIVGFLSGFIAAIGSELILCILQVRVFELGLSFHGWLWIATPLLGAALVGTSGYLSTRSVINSSPLTIIRGG